MVKYKALLGEKFDKSKVTVVGSPTITSDGIASGLQANNYISTPLFNLSELTEIEFDYDITTKEQTGSVYLCGLKDTALSLYIAKTGYMQLLAGNTYSTAIIPPTAYNVGKLHFRFVINPISLKAFVYVFQNGNKIGEIDIAISSGALIPRRFIFGADYSGNYGYALNGSIDLKSIKVRQEGTVYTPTKPTYLLERRKPKVWNKGQFTIVGNPSISDSGVASGFNTDNDFIVANKTISNYKELVFENKFVYKLNTSRLGVLYWTNGIQLRNLIQTNGSIQFITEKDSKYYSITFPANNFKEGDIIETKVIVNSSLFVAQVKVNDKVVSQESIENLVGLPDITKVGIGASYAGKGAYTGSINLKSFKLYTDNTLVFDGGAETYVYDPSKFTVVGSPTITEYGVASGFTANDYVISNYNLEENKTYTFVVEGIGGVPRTDRGSYIFSAFYNSGGSDNLRVITGVNNGIVRFALGGVVADVSTTFAISDGVKYKIELKTDFKSFVTFTDLLTGYTLTKTDYTITNQTYGNNVITYGTSKSVAPLTNCSINLPDFSITVDNKEVFTGAKENYYMLNGI